MNFSSVKFLRWWYLYDERANCIVKAKQKSDRKLEVTAGGYTAVYFL